MANVGARFASDGVLAMSKREREYSSVMRRIEGGLGKGQAATKLEISRRHVSRLYSRWRLDGDAALVSRQRGKVGNRRRLEARSAFIAWYGGLSPMGRYAPKHASEMYQQESGVRINKESARLWLVEAGYWVACKERRKRAHKLRERRPRRGELVQIDGSDHRWLGGHRFVLLQFIDDATSELLHAEFVESENTFAYMKAFEAYIRRHGIPRIIYTDAHGVFYNNNKREELTQFGRAMAELEVEMLLSSTPQARGRVERAHDTAQKRLPCEMANRAGFTGGDLKDAIAAGNRYLRGWIEDRNRRFTHAPKEPQDAHRPLSLSDEQLSRLFSKRYRRKVTPNCDFSYDGKRYVIDNHGQIGKWRHKSGVFVDIYHHYSDTMSVFHCGRQLAYYPAGEAPHPTEAVCGRRLNEAADNALARRNKYIPPPSHPWKAASYRAQMERKARNL